MMTTSETQLPVKWFKENGFELASCSSCHQLEVWTKEYHDAHLENLVCLRCLDKAAS